MELEIKLFATLKDRVGQNVITVTIAEPAGVPDLLAAVTESYPELATSLPTVLVAVNRNYAGEDTDIHSGDEVAFFDCCAQHLLFAGGAFFHCIYKG